MPSSTSTFPYVLDCIGKHSIRKTSKCSRQLHAYNQDQEKPQKPVSLGTLTSPDIESSPLSRNELLLYVAIKFTCNRYKTSQVNIKSALS